MAKRSAALIALLLLVACAGRISQIPGLAAVIVVIDLCKLGPDGLTECVPEQVHYRDTTETGVRLACTEFKEYPLGPRRARFFLVDSAGRFGQVADCKREGEK